MVDLSRTDDELKQLSNAVNESLRYIVDDYVSDEESNIYIASLFIKAGLSLYQGVLSEFEIRNTLAVINQELTKIQPYLPDYIKKH